MWLLPFACSETPDLVIHGVGVTDGRIVSITAPADGLLVTPGLIDAHAHPAGVGTKLAQLDLSGTASLAEVRERVAEAAVEGDGWLMGRGWDQNDWGDHEGWPNATHLDHASRPVALRRVDGHALWVNTAGLQAAGITADTPDPDGGRILRDDTGAPTGVLIDAAVGLVDRPTPSTEESRRRLVQALDFIAASGLVGVHDMGVSDQTLSFYEELAASGELPIRIWAYLDPGAGAVERLKRDGPWGFGKLRVVGVKMYADGALGSRGALLSDPYSDEAETHGLAINSIDDLDAMATDLLAARAQLAVHAIGDRGISNVLDAFERARAAQPAASDVPLRVEHLQVVRPEDLSRMPGLNAVASMQPTHATSDGPWAEDRLGPDRVQWSYAWRDVLDAGVVLAFGSDFPVEEVSPKYGLWSATTRSDLGGGEGWRMDQALSFDEAVAGFTSGTYAALGEDGGDLEVGSVADLCVWRVEERFGHAWYEPVEVVVGGTIVWSSED